MGRHKKYTPEALRAAAEAWMDSITITAPVMAAGPDGDMVPARNDAGELVVEKRFVIPPLEGGLCDYLDISYVTWDAYRDDPAYAPIIQEVKARIKAYLQRELLVREGKNTRGVEFTLSANYGVSPNTKQELELGPRASAATAAAGLPLEERLALLREVAEEFGQDQ